MCKKAPTERCYGTRHRQRLLSATLFLLALSQTACTTIAPATAEAERVVTRPSIATPSLPEASQAQRKTVEKKPNIATARATNPATKVLREQASSAIELNDLPQATRLLERALRIDPRDPATYYVFARLRQSQGMADAAEQLIQKGLSLRPDSKLKRNLTALRKSLNDSSVQ